MAHLRDILYRKCPCGKKATVELYNQYNALSGYFCTACGKRQVQLLSKMKS